MSYQIGLVWHALLTFASFGQIWHFLTPPQYFFHYMKVQPYTHVSLGIFLVTNWGVLAWVYPLIFWSEFELINSSSIPYISRVVTHTYNLVHFLVRFKIV